MKLVTAEQMRTLEKKYFELYGIPSALLMEAAAIAVYRHCAEFLSGEENPFVVILCGKGNNGGDGFAVARYLASDGADVKIFLTAPSSALKGDAKMNFDLANKTGIPIIELTDSQEIMRNLSEELSRASLVVDALLGTGLSSAVTGIYEKVINEINARARYILSIDVPSGLNSDTGQTGPGCMGEQFDDGTPEGFCHRTTSPFDVCVRAHKTVTLGLGKQGLYVYPGVEYCGETVLEGIGLPRALTIEVPASAEILSDSQIKKLLPKRIPRSNKSTYGRLYLFGGSLEMPGAAVICAEAAYRAGAGLVKACVCPNVAEVIHSRIPEAVTAVLPCENGKLCKESFDALAGDLSKADAIIIGPGLGISPEVKELVEQVILNAQTPLILDADALNVISENISLLLSIKKLSIVTPHPMEMSRLLSGVNGKTVPDVLANPIEAAKEFSKAFGVVTVLKDAHTIVASPDGRVYINTTGSPAMSKAGAGDALCGIIGGMVAQKKDPFTAAVIGTFVHGKAGERASEKLSVYGVTASDIIRSLPEVLLTL